MPTLFTLPILIDHCKGIIPYQNFLIHLIKPLIERALRTKFKNIFIVRTELQERIDYSIKDKKILIPYLRIHWSADNHPDCQIIYANQTVYDLSEILSLYRDYQLDILLEKRECGTLLKERNQEQSYRVKL